MSNFYLGGEYCMPTYAALRPGQSPFSHLRPAFDESKATVPIPEGFAKKYLQQNCLNAKHFSNAFIDKVSISLIRSKYAYQMRHAEMPSQVVWLLNKGLHEISSKLRKSNSIASLTADHPLRPAVNILARMREVITTDNFACYTFFENQAAYRDMPAFHGRRIQEMRKLIHSTISMTTSYSSLLKELKYTIGRKKNIQNPLTKSRNKISELFKHNYYFTGNNVVDNVFSKLSNYFVNRKTPEYRRAFTVIDASYNETQKLIKAASLELKKWDCDEKLEDLDPYKM